MKCEHITVKGKSRSTVPAHYHKIFARHYALRTNCQTNRTEVQPSSQRYAEGCCSFNPQDWMPRIEIQYQQDGDQ
jgi:hypothetical protein